MSRTRHQLTSELEARAVSVDRDAVERERIRRAAPPAKEVAAALGPFKTCQEPTYTETPDGKWTLKHTSVKATAEENARRFATVVDMTNARRKLETDRSQRQAAERNTVAVHDVRTGEVREIPAEMEDHVARKSIFRPGRSPRVWIGFGRAR